MTDAEIMELLTRDCDNWQRGKVLREAFDAIKNAARPSALAIQPQKQRKPRQAKASRPVPTIATQDGEAVGQVGDEAA